MRAVTGMESKNAPLQTFLKALQGGVQMGQRRGKESGKPPGPGWLRGQNEAR